jgi:hypothetical protein
MVLADKNRSPSDPTRVNLVEEWEVQYWCTRFGCTEVALRRAVKEGGPDAAAVERKLKEAAKVAFKNTGED